MVGSERTDPVSREFEKTRIRILDQKKIKDVIIPREKSIATKRQCFTEIETIAKKKELLRKIRKVKVKSF